MLIVVWFKMLKMKIFLFFLLSLQRKHLLNNEIVSTNKPQTDVKKGPGEQVGCERTDTEICCTIVLNVMQHGEPQPSICTSGDWGKGSSSKACCWSDAWKMVESRRCSLEGRSVSPSEVNACLPFWVVCGISNRRVSGKCMICCS